MKSTQDQSFDSEVLDRLNERLQVEKKRLEREIRQEYRSARKFVRTNPEKGIGYAFLGGVIGGLLLASLFKR